MFNRGDIKRLERHVRRYDKSLCVLPCGNTVGIYAKGKTFVRYSYNGLDLFYSQPKYDLVFALTDNWSMSGQPIRWGSEVVLARLKAIDQWNNNPIKDMEEAREKAEDSHWRDFSNNTEAFLKDFRRQFAKATTDINTSTLEKIDRRRELDGYHQSRFRRF